MENNSNLPVYLLRSPDIWRIFWQF